MLWVDASTFAGVCGKLKLGCQTFAMSGYLLRRVVSAHNRRPLQNGHPVCPCSHEWTISLTEACQTCHADLKHRHQTILLLFFASSLGSRGRFRVGCHCLVILGWLTAKLLSGASLNQEQ